MKKERYFFTVYIFTFIYFRYALRSLLGIKYIVTYTDLSCTVPLTEFSHCLKIFPTNQREVQENAIFTVFMMFRGMNNSYMIISVWMFYKGIYIPIFYFLMVVLKN